MKVSSLELDIVFIILQVGEKKFLGGFHNSHLINYNLFYYSQYCSFKCHSSLTYYKCKGKDVKGIKVKYHS